MASLQVSNVCSSARLAGLPAKSATERVAAAPGMTELPGDSKTAAKRS
jgi:hypothetical protein